MYSTCDIFYFNLYILQFNFQIVYLFIILHNLFYCSSHSFKMSGQVTPSTSTCRRLELEAKKREIELELEILSSTHPSRYSPVRSDISSPMKKMSKSNPLPSPSSGSSLPLGQGSIVRLPCPSPVIPQSTTPTKSVKPRVMKMTSETRAARKARRRITPEFISLSFTSDSSLFSNTQKSEESSFLALANFKKLCNSAENIKAVLTVLEGWSSENGSIFNQSDVSSETVTVQLDFIEYLSSCIQSGSFKIFSMEFELAMILIKNPLTGLKLFSFVLVTNMDSDIEEIVETIGKLETKPDGSIFLPEHNISEHRSNNSSFHFGNLSSGQKSLPNLSVSNINPLMDKFTPELNSIPIQPSKSATPRISSSPSKSFPHFPDPADGFLLGNGFKKIDLSNSSVLTFSKLHSEADNQLQQIVNIQGKYERKTVKEWINLHNKNSLTPPSLTSYYPEVNAEFLAESFQGEPLPGVYLPGGSGLTQKEAFEAYSASKGYDPPTLVQLNKFIADEFEQTTPTFDPNVHYPVEPFNIDLYSALNLPMDSTVSRGGDTPDRLFHPYN